MEKINLFFIKTPFQLINAKELIEKENINDNNLLIITTLNSNSYHQIINYFDKNNWFKVITIIPPVINDSYTLLNRVRTKLAFIRMWIKWKNKLNKLNKEFLINHIVTGNYFDPVFQISVNNCSFNRVYAVDDGTATFSIIKKRDEEVKTGISSFFKNKNSLFTYLFNIKKNVLNKVVFFSIYKLNLKTNDQVIKNKFKLMKIRAKPVGHKAFFLGGPFISKGMLDKNKYIEVLKIITQRYSKLEFFYLPHRKETENELKLIGKHIQVLTTNEPIETYCLKLDELPGLFIGFYSSALINLKQMYQSSSTDIIAIKTKFNIPDERTNALEEIYEEFKKNYQIELLEL